MQSERNDTVVDKAEAQRVARATLIYRDGSEIKNPMFKDVVVKRTPAGRGAAHINGRGEVYSITEPRRRDAKDAVKKAAD